MVLKRVVLISALTSMGCLTPLTGVLAQQGTTGQGQTGSQGATGQRQTATPPGAARDQGSSADQQGQAGTAAGASGVSTQHGTGGSLSQEDRQFLQKAAQGGMAEVELGRLAQQNAGSDAVKEFGALMERQHSQNNSQLMQVIQDHGMTPPTSVDAKHKTLMSRLSGLSGKDFDRAYMAAMVQDHQEEIKEFEETVKTSDVKDIKQYAQQTLPVLREHLQQATSLNSKLTNK